MAEVPPSTSVGESQPSDPSIISINVGGHLFQTTSHTLSLAGPNSILSSLLPGSRSFFDRDPSLFSSLLSLLRSSSPKTNPEDLLVESLFFGIDSSLLLPKFDPFSLQKSLLLPLHGRDPPSVLAAHRSGSIHVAHAGKLTSFDATLSRRTTALTPLPAIDSLFAISPSLVAAGAADFPSLHLLDVSSGRITQALNWSPTPLNTSPASVVQAVGASPEHLFSSFESSRRTASVIVAFDLNTFEPVAEIGRKEIYGAELDSAIPATKLRWVESSHLLLASGSHSGPSGLIGNIRLWDIRSRNPAWETTEKNDCFADVTVSDALMAMFKIGMNSGEVYMMDLRKLSSGQTAWICLGDAKKSMAIGRKEGSGCRIESYENIVFVSRGGEVEMWTEVAMADGQTTMKRNLIGRKKDMGGSKISQMVFGGNRMVLARKEEQCVEVWQSSN